MKNQNESKVIEQSQIIQEALERLKSELQDDLSVWIIEGGLIFFQYGAIGVHADNKERLVVNFHIDCPPELAARVSRALSDFKDTLFIDCGRYFKQCDNCDGVQEYDDLVAEVQYAKDLILQYMSAEDAAELFMEASSQETEDECSSKTWN